MRRPGWGEQDGQEPEVVGRRGGSGSAGLALPVQGMGRGTRHRGCQQIVDLASVRFKYPRI